MPILRLNWSEIRASSSGRWLVIPHLAEEDSDDEWIVLSVFDARNLRHVRDHRVLYDGGPRRAAVSPDGCLVGSGTFMEGVSVYDEQGKVVWRRAGEGFQSITFWSNTRVGVEWEPFQYTLYDIVSREEVADLPGIRNVFIYGARETFVAHNALEKMLQLVDANGNVQRNLIPMEGYAGDVCYDPRKDIAYVAEADGPFYAIALETGVVLWAVGFQGLNRDWIAWSQGAVLTFDFDPNSIYGQVTATDPATGRLIQHTGTRELRRWCAVYGDPLRRVDVLGQVYELTSTRRTCIGRIVPTNEGTYRLVRRSSRGPEA